MNSTSGVHKGNYKLQSRVIAKLEFEMVQRERPQGRDPSGFDIPLELKIL